MIHDHVKSRDRRVQSHEEPLRGVLHILITEERRYVPIGYKRGKWDRESVALTPAELLKICQAHGIFVPDASGKGK